MAAQSLGASTTLSRWNELEIELTGGRPRLLRAAAKRLRRRGLRPAGRSAKLERALAVGARPAGPLRRPGRGRAVGRPGGRRPARWSSRTSTSRRARLKALDTAVRREEPDAVHQMRVTTRRLRAGLRAFPLVLPEPATRRLRDELRWLGRVLGDARDLEVLDQHFQTALDRLPTELVIGPAKARVTAHFAPGAGGGAGRGAGGAGVRTLLRDPRRARPPARRPAANGGGGAAGRAGSAAGRRARLPADQAQGAPGEAGACGRRPRRRPARGQEGGQARPLRGRRRRAGARQAGAAVRQADEGGPVRPRRPPGRGDRPHGRPRDRHAGAPGGRERLQLRAAERARAPRRA